MRHEHQSIGRRSVVFMRGTHKRSVILHFTGATALA